MHVVPFFFSPFAGVKESGIVVFADSIGRMVSTYAHGHAGINERINGHSMHL